MADKYLARIEQEAQNRQQLQFHKHHKEEEQ
jgi:hypothetical protein